MYLGGIVPRDQAPILLGLNDSLVNAIYGVSTRCFKGSNVTFGSALLLKGGECSAD